MVGARKPSLSSARRPTKCVSWPYTLLPDGSHVSRQKIRTWFHNTGRAGAKLPTHPSETAVKPDLRLNRGEKRKVAAVQAYCAYAWDSGLRETVIKRWGQQNKSQVSADEGDPDVDASHIPLDFKLKVAKDVFNSLTPEQKKEVDDRREENRKKLYRPIADIEDERERVDKLLVHQK